MRHFLRASLAIAPLSLRVMPLSAQGSLVALPGRPQRSAAGIAPARTEAVALTSVTSSADAHEHTACCAVSSPVCVHVPLTGDWTSIAPGRTLIAPVSCAL